MATVDKLPDLPIVRPNFYGFYAGDKIQKVLDSGIVTNNGPYVQEFERQLTEYLGAPTLCFSSGMAALVTALMTQIEPDRETWACPSFTFAATPHALKLAGANPHWVDIKNITDDITIDPAMVDDAVEKWGLKGVLAVDPYGVLCNDKDLGEVCRHHGIPLVIDSAAAFGTQGASPRGDVQIFSFHATKAFTTMEGGCLTSRNPEIIKKASRIRNFGQDENGNCPMVGFNGKMTEIAAIIGLEQLKTWKKTLAHRQNMAELLMGRIDEPWLYMLDLYDLPYRCVWTYVPAWVHPMVGLREWAVYELRKRGIMARKYYSPPCHFLKCYDSHVNLPFTDKASNRVIALPVYNDMTEQEVDRIAGALQEMGPKCGY